MFFFRLPNESTLDWDIMEIRETKYILNNGPAQPIKKAVA